MDHEALREQVNEAMKTKALTGLTSEGPVNVAGLSSGSMMLNNALSGSPFVGYAWGRLTEIYGPEMSGKTTLALHAIHEAQRLEQATGVPVPCLFVDAEYTLSLKYAQDIGVDIDNLSVYQDECVEDIFEVILKSVATGFKVIVVDSVASMSPRAEIEGEMGEAHVGLKARLMSQGLRKLTSLAADNGAHIFFLNQIRFKIGVTFGNPETTPGGNALKHHATYRLDARSPRSGKKGGKTLMGFGEGTHDEEVGTITNVSVRKNKVFPPHRKASFHVEYGVGIDKVKDTIEFLEFANAFAIPARSKDKVPRVKIPSKGKMYTKRGLAKILHEPEVQADVIELIKRLEVVD